MAVSKRLRYEILRRDNYQCRYCGGSAPEVPLTVDHVVPVTLGGTDDSSNLVAACKDCNAGKSSASPDAGMVTDVAADAFRWAKAMEVVARERSSRRLERVLHYQSFELRWMEWGYVDKYGDRKTEPLPTGWKFSIDNFLDAGLNDTDLEELIEVAMHSRADDTWKYFCGCCWRRIKDAQEHARNLLLLVDEHERNG